MKKLIQLVILMLFFNSCEINSILQDYEKINNKWEIVSTSGLTDNIKNEITYFDLSLCKPKRKGIKNDSYGCIGSVNDSDIFGLALSYSLRTKQVLSINNFKIIIEIESGILRQRKLTDQEINLSKELSGEWIYEIRGDNMTWINDKNQKLELKVKM